MKKITIVIILLFAYTHVSNAQKWLDILNAIVETADAVLNPVYKDVLTKTIEINSATKLGGDTRKVISFNLPAGTRGWYYRITPMDISNNYAYAPNERLYYLIKNKMQNVHTPPFGTYAIVDHYVFSHSADANNFNSKRDFRWIKGHGHKGRATSYYPSKAVYDNLWIGIKNPNKFKGLNVIVEVVSWGYN